MSVEDWLIERQERLYVVAWEAYLRAYSRDGLGFQQAMERAVQAVLAALGDQPYHVAEFAEERYVIQHPLACRPDLISCPYSEAECADPPAELGRYRVAVMDGSLVPVNKEKSN